jgi:membrane associated rhomboid family serine protease
MAGGPELFVVCKNCQAEVSPYITECPYCGHRLRKRAPKLEKGGTPRPQRRARRAKPSRLGRLRANEIPGIRADGRPYVSLALVAAPLLVTVLGRALVFNPLDIVLLAGGETWRAATTLFFYGNTGYEVVAVGAVFLFAWLLERRHGWWAPLLVFAAGGVGGMALVLAADSTAFATGANGAALALLAAWAVRDLLARRRGEEIDSDLLGVLVIATVLILLPAAVEEAHALAGAFGAVIGLALGLPLARMPER